MKERSNGSTAGYYQLPDGATHFQDLISQRNMNAQIGEIFRACYRYGLVEHSDMLRDARKILFYAKAEMLIGWGSCRPNPRLATPKRQPRNATKMAGFLGRQGRITCARFQKIRPFLFAYVTRQRMCAPCWQRLLG